MSNESLWRLGSCFVIMVGTAVAIGDGGFMEWIGCVATALGGYLVGINPHARARDA